MPKPNLGDILKKSIESIENIKNEVKLPMDNEKNVGASKKDKKREKTTKKAKTNKGERKTKEIKAKAIDKKNKGKTKGKGKSKEEAPLSEKSWHLDKVKSSQIFSILTISTYSLIAFKRSSGE